MGKPICPVCGDSAVIEYDSAAGNVVCTTCGYVVDENTIVSDVTFGESSNGAAVLQGAQLGATDLRARIVGPRGRPQASAESRAQTLENGLRNLLSMAHGLNLSEVIAESAHRFFTLALSNGFVMGRRSPYVLASCIYVACRMNKLPTMLIDISDFLQVNVFIVGATYLKLVKELCLTQIPLIDPSLYISRFAALLEFGEETEKVAYDATRLVKRFDHDWITTGRRPSGIAGACLLIAARMNNFKRSVLEIVQVVKIADVTIKKRLDEFKRSETGKMTVEDFRNQWLEEAENPPAFQKGKRKLKKKKNKKLKKIKKNEDGLEEELSDEESESESEEEEEEEDQVKISRSVSSTAPPPTNTQNSSQGGLTQLAIGKLNPDQSKAKVRGEDEESEASLIIEERRFDEDAEESDRWYENRLDEAITQEVEAHLISGTGSLLQNELSQREINQQNQFDDHLSDLDEDELDCFILNENEVEIKTRVWMELNREYLEKLAEKKEREATGEIKPTKKYASKPKAKPRDSENPGGATVGESVMNMINSKKKLSSKINYKIADSLFGKGKTKKSSNSENQKQKQKKADQGIKNSKASTIKSKDFHSSLLGGGGGAEEDDDDEEEEEEEQVVLGGEEIEFEMMKRGNFNRDEDEGWGEEV
ncbi:uncharacterized protein MELLADRAFT_92647 [Melampsora larici-populina 98AG31]|uniref:B-related factor 1 n=1 Tax=Melampsora larici-populina (strain 98AG31 / pathotype 3-4-7) TaxID=747676 RepID=F4S2A5_MELLP|nr:uncharacterized protein MELLADRAFT_92647 [Melampsora larici-populina 98AG31]EGG01140.1 hypothetical protein MELLADRAFT_92647 [Melampsora larici-populina 98AG31]